MKNNFNFSNGNYFLTILLTSILFMFTSIYSQAQDKWVDWHRPVDNPVFTVDHGNNHDALLFVDTTLEYPYHLIVSGRGCTPDRGNNPEAAYLWRTKNFSWSSEDWELVSKHYQIGCHYEYDDGVKVDGKYYIFEGGNVYTFEGSLEEAAGRWKKEGTFPFDQCDDVGVYYEDGVFHLFGEYGHFPHGPDGSSLSHLTSETGLGDWTLEDTLAANPNPGGGNAYGVGDPTIEKIKGNYYIFCDIESPGSPYKVIAWKSESLDSRFEYQGVAMQARLGEKNDWDNYRIQDADIAYIPGLSRYVMVCNMMDRDGIPGGYFPTLDGFTRVVGFIYSDAKLENLGE
jgi:hypothetical protein